MMLFKNLYFAGSVFLSMAIAPVPVLAQASASDFDPAHPFAKVKAPDQWVTKFTPAPKFVPNDPYGNMVTSEMHLHGWKGQNIDDPKSVPQNMKGSGGGKGPSVRSPYPYKSAEEQYNAWLTAAHGGTHQTRATTPDWSGDWQGRSRGVLDGQDRVSDVLAAISDPYKERYVQLLRAEWLGHIWLPAEFCMPTAFANYWNTTGGTWHFLADDHMVLINSDKDTNPTRYIYTDGRGFLPKDKAAPAWYGQSEGFWDGDELIIYSKGYRAWLMDNARPEYSDKLETVERWKRFGNEMLVDITMYDPVAFAFPWHDVAVFHTLKNWTEAPATYSECVTTNNVYLDRDGMEDEHVPGDIGYRDLSDRRPWATAYKLWDAAHPSVPQWTVPK